jgi:hypothetical protein
MRDNANHRNAPLPAPSPPAPERCAPKPYFAATSEGMKQINVAVSPAKHKRLKRLAVEIEIERSLMREASADLFAKHEGLQACESFAR